MNVKMSVTRHAAHNNTTTQRTRALSARDQLDGATQMRPHVEFDQSCCTRARGRDLVCPPPSRQTASVYIK